MGAERDRGPCWTDATSELNRICASAAKRQQPVLAWARAATLGGLAVLHHACTVSVLVTLCGVDGVPDGTEAAGRRQTENDC